MADNIKKSEIWGAAILFGLHSMLFPALIGIIYIRFPDFVSNAQLNFVYYCTSTVLAFVLLGKFLRRSFDTLCDNLFGAVIALGLGWMLYMVLNVAVTYLVLALGIDTEVNNDMLIEMAGEDRGKIVALCVFLSPIVEECIFRAGLFGGIYRKNRIAAYAISIAAFSLYHVWQYAAAYGDLSYLLIGIAYIPASFVLCWVYERSGSVWVSIFFHMAYNFYAVSVMM